MRNSLRVDNREMNRRERSETGPRARAINGGKISSGPVPPIARRAELDQRVEARPKPNVERQLKINGWQQVKVHCFAADKPEPSDRLSDDHRLAN